MSLAEALEGRARGIAPYRGGVTYAERRSCWFDDFEVEEECVGEPQQPIDVVPAAPPVDSKILFLISAKLPHSDKLQVNFSRRVRNFCIHMVACEVAHFELPHHKTDSWNELFQVKQRPLDLEHEKERVLFKSAKLLAEISDKPETELFEMLRQLFTSELTARVAASKVPEKVLETFVGYVDQVDGDTAYVRLKSQAHGDVLHGKYSASELASKGICEQSRFLCETVKVGDSTRLDLKTLPDVEVSEEELRDIDERIHRVIPRDDPGIDY